MKKRWDEYPLIHRPGHPMADRDGFVPKRLVQQDGVSLYVISDDLGQQLEHHGFSDGRRTDSKSKFRKWTKEAGLVEKGNDRTYSKRKLASDPQNVVRDVGEAVNMLKNGYRPKLGEISGLSKDFSKGWV